MPTKTPQAVEEIVRPVSRPQKDKGRKTIAKNYNKLQVLKIVYVATDSVFPNAYNPNRQSDREFELLLSSMTEDGFTTPVVVQKKTNQIVDGEHRWRAATRLGLTEIPVVFVDMTPEQQRIATLRHNRARGSEDVELTIKILQDLRELGALEQAVTSLHITDRELKVLIDDLPAPEQMAGQTFSPSWIPTDIGKEPALRTFEDKEIHIHKKALEEKEEFTNQLANAPSLTDQGELSKMVAKKFTTITFIMEGKKAAFVKKTLGDEEAPEKLLKMACLKVYNTPHLMEQVERWNEKYLNTFYKIIGKKRPAKPLYSDPGHKGLKKAQDERKKKGIPEPKSKRTKHATY